MAPRIARFYTTLNDQYRQAMRSVGSCVSIITCRGSNGQEAGMTISSLSSVSMTPKPIISFNIQVPSRTSRILDESGGHFAVNIIPASSDMKDLALAFSGSRGHAFNPFTEFSRFFDTFNDNGVDIPIVKGSHTMVCQVYKQIPIQDHLAIFASTRIVINGSKDSMMYKNSRFHALGPEVE